MKKLVRFTVSSLLFAAMFAIVPFPASAVAADQLCYLSADKQFMNFFETGRLSWYNPDPNLEMTITGIDGPVPHGIGSLEVAPDYDTIYTGIVRNKESQHVVGFCQTIMRVGLPGWPECELTPNPQYVGFGGATFLEARTNSPTIGTAIYGVTVIRNEKGHAVVSPSRTTKYDALAFELNGFSPLAFGTCSVKVPVIPNPVPACAIKATPENVKAGESAVVRWVTNDATAGVVFTLDGIIKPPGTGGEITVTPSETTEFKGVVAYGDDQGKCSATVKVWR